MRQNNIFARLLGNMVVCLLFCLSAPLIHIVYASLVWEDSVGQFYRVVNAELQSLVLISNKRTEMILTTVVESVYAVVSQSSGIMEIITGPERSFIRGILVEYWEVVQLFLLSVQLISLRLGVLVLSLPLLFSAVIVGLCNGGLIWYLRRSAGARDSSFVYHRLKAATYFGVGVFLAVYIFPPVVMDPRWIIPIFGLSMGVLTSTTVGLFKKYV